MKDFVKTPLNYTGNKFRLLEQLQEHFPKDIEVMVDLFCGGATVGLNTPCQEVYFIDNNPYVIGLLDFFSRQDFNSLLQNLEKLIAKYKLSNTFRNGMKFYKDKVKDENQNNGIKEYNKNSYYDLRQDYNSLKDKTSDKAFTMLYLLLLYGFNNDLRFNSKGEFNLPIGKTDFNRANVEKLKKYLLKTKTIKAHFCCLDFDSVDSKAIYSLADFVYMDPPYLITTATYNESNNWNFLSEKRLLNLLDDFIINRKDFTLSNVLAKKTAENKFLSSWIRDNDDFVNVYHLKYSYSSSSYNKKNRDGDEDEIIVCYSAKNEDKQQKIYRQQIQIT